VFAEAQGQAQHARLSQASMEMPKASMLLVHRLKYSRLRITRSAANSRTCRVSLFGVHGLVWQPSFCGVEIEPFESTPAMTEKTFSASVSTPLERLARTDSMAEPSALTNSPTKRHAVVPHLAEGVRHAAPAHREVVRPAGDGGVVSSGPSCPAQHHVAKPKSAVRIRLGHAKELCPVQQLAAHAVDVADGLYLLCA
jgi:hypothetical protein